MADRFKLAQGLRNLPASAQEDLAGREQDIQRGKTVELLRRAGKEMYNNPIVNTAIGFTPGVGDVQAAGETFAALQRGAPWQETAGYAVGMLPFVPALRTTWHGSPHGFTKFDMSKIGTGEGSQAFAHGLYLAEAPETAKSYQAMANNPARRQGGLRGEGKEQAMMDSLIRLNAKKYTEGDVNRLAELVAQRPAAFTNPEKMIARIGEYENNVAPSYLYKVDLPDEQIAKMFDWDNPISEEMRKPISNAMMEKFGSGLSLGTGEQAYKQIVDEFRLAGSKDPRADASQWLYQQGVPGVHYLDEASRGAGEGTRNYVVFSDEIPQILERNGQPIAQALRDYKQQFPEGMLGKTGIFETGTPASFEYIRNTEKSPYMGERFGQDIEPAGRYLSYKEPSVNMESMPNTWETGQVSFNNPLVVNFGEGYGTPTNWKKMVSESFGGKTGKDLSKAVANAGYDGIVTVDKYGTSEIVDLSNFIGKQK